MIKSYWIKFSHGWTACTKSEYKYYAMRGYVARVSYEIAKRSYSVSRS